MDHLLFIERGEVLAAVHRGAAQEGLRDQPEVLRQEVVPERRVLRRPAHGGPRHGRGLPRQHGRGGGGGGKSGVGQETGAEGVSVGVFKSKTRF